MTVDYRLQSLEDFLISRPLTIDGVADDGWGAMFPVKGREIEGTVLFADISGFSRRTKDLTPAETLAFVNNFFAWITAEALRNCAAIVDKYIGDEIMVVFSREFGSSDPFADAISAARSMGENDFLSFRPHIGLASGAMIVGYTGTPIRHSCSVFGSPVAMASRCASVQPSEGCTGSTRIVFPAVEWGERDFDTLVPPRRYTNPDGTTTPKPQTWKLHNSRTVAMKNIGDVRVREVVNQALHRPMQSATDRAIETVRQLRRDRDLPEDA